MVSAEIQKDPKLRVSKWRSNRLKGAERLAYRFYEIKKDGPTRELKRVGKRLTVAKESKYIEDEAQKEKFHETFAEFSSRLAICLKNSEAVHKAPKLKPKEDEVASSPKITSQVPRLRVRR